ncbi:unnamed protein product [Cylindrotheca closterium]|uniref:Uncharacterized protein n=1 Tax=Cylindrotheca closterium TaxID=2856 RepID=A0AAD2G2Q9_9STRA|nr:unnamed protein product [Cylindrotheca closterium]
MTTSTTTTGKRVCFSPTVQAASAGPLPFDEVKELWYNRTELITFKSKAKQVISQSGLTVADPELRGLEHCTADRQKHKFMSIRCTISAARRGLGEEHVASISQRCTAWNQQNAFLQGCHDYCNVYKPAMASSIPEMTNTPPAFPFAMRKRVVTADATAIASTFTRRVRRRVASTL